jgi:anti-sigma factor ChrR (cupin superfamily)
LGAKFRGEVARKRRLQRVFITVFLVLTAGAFVAKAQETTSRTNAAITPKSLNWQPFSPGVEVAVLQGTLTENGPFTIRLRLRAGTEIPPHWHTTDENMTILKGVFGLAVGDTFEKVAIRYMAPGAFISLPKGIHHFALSKTDSIVQVHGVGPFVMTFVQRR